MRVAVIDLGTNTCNLLIAEMNSPGLQNTASEQTTGKTGRRQNQ
jgi:exopolyphosphatase/pppGpp-phosphohydrolase